jgi:hypothetical protein
LCSTLYSYFMLAYSVTRLTLLFHLEVKLSVQSVLPLPISLRLIPKVVIHLMFLRSTYPSVLLGELSSTASSSMNFLRTSRRRSSSKAATTALWMCARGSHVGSQFTR